MIKMTGREVISAFWAFNGDPRNPRGSAEALKNRGGCANTAWYLWAGRTNRVLTAVAIEIEETRERLRKDLNDDNAEEIHAKINGLDKEVFEVDVKPFLVRRLGKVDLTVGESTGLAPLLEGDVDDAEAEAT